MSNINWFKMLPSNLEEPQGCQCEYCVDGENELDMCVEDALALGLIDNFIEPDYL